MKSDNSAKLIGPFTQLVTMDNLPRTGPLSDRELEVIPDSGIVVKAGRIEEIGNFDALKKSASSIEEISGSAVVIPGLIDAHTHICFSGDRSQDYALRLSGKTYQQIAGEGGGILDTVRKTRNASKEELKNGILKRLDRMAASGITMCEIKSGYGLTCADEIKMLEAIALAQEETRLILIPTCLAAHTLPPEFSTSSAYLEMLIGELLPIVKEKRLSKRVDIFVEKGAFSTADALAYLNEAKNLGFTVTVHADQFSIGGSSVAADAGAVSADHLEVINDEEIKKLKEARVIPVALPGASLGLGLPFAPARKLLDQGLSLAIASDWNPGSAPMGQLLTQAALLGAYEHLSMAETLAAITVRAAYALKKDGFGLLKKGALANFTVFPCSKYTEILYNQGSLQPMMTYINGDPLEVNYVGSRSRT